MRTIAVIGLGYVGLPVAVAFAKEKTVIGFDINQKRLAELDSHFDRNLEVSPEELKNSKIIYTADIEKLKSADFYIVTVPTPVTSSNKPDLSLIYKATETVAHALKAGDIVIFESTVYPGLTEEECVPIMEKISGLKLGKDFGVGYSPERINPGDKKHSFTKIQKVVSGSSPEVLEIVANVYSSVVEAGVYRAASIKVAEAAKVIENTQRDINIAFMNELSIIFDKMNINTHDVLATASTKWNFLNFYPGLVGGHCIGVDPYYLTHKAETLGYRPQVILSGRKINDSMGPYIAQKIVKALVKNQHNLTGATVTVFGLTFKENTPDIRNSKIVDIIEEIKSFGINVQVTDPLANIDEAIHEYGIELTPLKDLKPANIVVLAVAHDNYKTITTEALVKKYLLPNNPIVFGIKTHLLQNQFEALNVNSWFL